MLKSNGACQKTVPKDIDLKRYSLTSQLDKVYKITMA